MGDSTPSKDNMLHLTTLPPEVLHHILQFLDPADIATLPRVCPDLRLFTKHNQKLHRDVYLSYFDKPQNLKLDWESELLDVVRLQEICRREYVVEKAHELDFVHDVVNRLLLNASPSASPTPSLDGKGDPTDTHAHSLNAGFLQDLFDDQTNREAFLYRSSLFERARKERPGRGPSKVTVRQRSAKLHCLYGKPCLRIGVRRPVLTAPYARSKVYDLRQYTRRTRWGPFLDDGSDRVDWEKVEAVMVSLGHNIGFRYKFSQIFKEVWGQPFSGSWSGSCKQPSPGRDISTLEARDPYDVSGIWYRIVCFLDYNDFFSYNFPGGNLIGHDTPRPALDVDEVSRIIMMKIHVTKIEPPGPDDGQDLPVVYFKGTSRSLDNSFDDDANSNIRGIECKGTVRLTREGEVRWTTFSIFHGQERWRSEGVQIGGVRSARGVVGHWFDRDYDRHGPAGPTAFWKGVSNATQPPVQDLLPNEFFLPNGSIITLGDLADEPDDDYSGSEDDEEDEEILELDIEDEIPGLLFDAGLDLMDVVDATHH